MKVKFKEEDGWLYTIQTGDGWSEGYGEWDAGLNWWHLEDVLTEADARAKTLIYLLENDLFKH